MRVAPVIAVALDRHGNALCLSAVAAVLAAVLLITPTIHNGPDGWVIATSFLLATLCCAAAWTLVERIDPRTGLIIILVTAFAIRFGYLFIQPLLSTDMYRYIWDGRVIAEGINPYRYIPAAPELQYLRDPVIYPWINRADYAVTIYPPMAQIFFFLATRFGQSVFSMKAAMVGCEVVIIAGLLSLLRTYGQSPLKIVAYAWHPLPIWEIAGNGHVDAVMVALLIFALVFFLRGSVLLAGVIATCGALVKPTALLALPVFWRPWNWKLMLAVPVTIVLLYLPFLSVGTGVLGFVPEYITEEKLDTASGFRLVLMMQGMFGTIPHATTIYLTLSAVALIALAVAAGFRRDRSNLAALRWLNWLLIAFLLLTSPHYPWYFLVLVPFLVLAPSAGGWIFTAASVLLYADHYTTHDTRQLVLTGLMLIALAFDYWRGFFTPSLSPYLTREAT